MKIAITTRGFGQYDAAPLEHLKSKVDEVTMNPYGRQPKAEETIALLEGASGMIAGTETLSRKVFDACPDLKVVSRCGVGLDSVDLLAAREKGVKVLSTPQAPVNAVAELTLAMILNCLRQVHLVDREIRRKIWKPRMGRLLCGKTVGILGLGRIGQRVAALLEPFGVTLLAHDIAPQTKFLEERKAVMVGLEELLRRSDIVTIHLPLEERTHYILSRKQLEEMKEGAILINVSRGGIVNDGQLYEALKSGRLGAAGIDVFEEEPYEGGLLELDNVVLTSHIGSYALESRVEMEWEAVKNLLRALGLEGPPSK